MVGPAVCIVLILNGREENWKRKLLRKRAFLSQWSQYVFLCLKFYNQKAPTEGGRKEGTVKLLFFPFKYLKSCPFPVVVPSPGSAFTDIVNCNLFNVEKCILE